MSKKIMILLLVVALLFSLVGCGDIEYKSAQVTVERIYHKDAYTQLIWIGGRMMPITHAEQYGIVVSYEGKESVICDTETYHKYKDCVGEKVDAVLKVITRRNGKVAYEVVSIGE